MWSSLLGSADYVFATGSWLTTSSNDRFFTQGYGDIEKVRKIRKSFLDEWANDALTGWFERSAPLDLSWVDCDNGENRGQPEIDLDDCVRTFERDSQPGCQQLRCLRGKKAQNELEGAPSRIYDATFTSPLAEHLPQEVGTGHIRFVLPDGPVRGIVLHAAATNTEDYECREKKLAEPLLAHGIASVIMIVPYYGQRRAEGQISSKLLTVADYQLQNLGVVCEGVALLRWLHTAYPAIPLGVTGISWGGAMASCIGVTCRMPVACVPCLGSTSPACMVTGVINWQLDWETLMQEGSHTLEEAKDALEEEFRSITLKSLVDNSPEPVITIASMVQVSAENDYFVHAWESQVLYDAISPACSRHSHKWVSGGHVVSFVRADEDFISAIVEAFDTMLPWSTTSLIGQAIVSEKNAALLDS